MKNNKAFTLVELLVSLTIFLIVLTAIFGLMLTSARTYTSVNNNLSLQTESQLASNQLSNYLIDCNEAVGMTNSNTLVIINEDSNTTDAIYTAYVFEFDSSAKELNYGKTTVTKVVNAQGAVTYSGSLDDVATDLISKDVKSFTVTLNSNSDNNITSVDYTLDMENRTKELTVSKTVALRNSPQRAALQQ